MDAARESGTNDAHAMLLRARQLAFTNRGDEALRLIGKAEEMGADPASVCMSRGFTMLALYLEGRMDMLDGTLRWLGEACRLDKKNADCHAAMASALVLKLIHGDLRDMSLARQAYRYGRRAIKLGDRSYEAYISIAQALMIYGKTARAVPYFAKAYDAEPSSEMARALMGVCMSDQKGRPDAYYEEALEHLDAAQGNDPMLDFVPRSKADALAKLGRTEEALQILKELVGSRPEDKFVWILMGSIYVQRSDTEEAVKCYEKLKRLDPDAPPMDALFTL